MLQPQSYNHLLKLIQTELLSVGNKIGQIKAVTYWKLGRWIDLYLLHGEDRAKYGEKIYEMLEKKSGIGQKTLERAVRFSREFPIPTALSKLSWTHQLELLTLPDQTVRKQLAIQATKKNFTTRELKQEISKISKNSDRHLVKVPVTIFTPPKLKAVKGELYTYVILEKNSAEDPTKSVVDCGFGFDQTINIKDFSNATFGKTMQFTYRAEVQKVIDADTFKVRIDLGLGGSFSRQKIRLKGIDAPEIDTNKGKKAKAYVAKALKGLEFILIRTSKSDKYDRYLADVWYVPKLDQNSRKAGNVPRALPSEQAGTPSFNEKYLNQELLDLGLAKVWKL